MYKLLALTFLGAIAIVLCNKCHVSDGDDRLHCADINNMTCKGTDYAPYCHQITTDSSVQMNGVCSCEKYCFTDDECPRRGCGFTRRSKCQEAYTGSIEKFCACVRY